MQASWDIDKHLYGKHRGASMCRRITSSSYLSDFYTALGKKSGEIMHDTWLIKAHDIDRVRQEFLAEFFRLCSFELNRKPVCLTELRKRLFHPADGVPIPGYE